MPEVKKHYTLSELLETFRDKDGLPMTEERLRTLYSSNVIKRMQERGHIEKVTPVLSEKMLALYEDAPSYVKRPSTEPYYRLTPKLRRQRLDWRIPQVYERLDRNTFSLFLPKYEDISEAQFKAYVEQTLSQRAAEKGLVIKHYNLEGDRARLSYKNIEFYPVIYKRSGSDVTMRFDEARFQNNPSKLIQLAKSFEGKGDFFKKLYYEQFANKLPATSFDAMRTEVVAALEKQYGPLGRVYSVSAESHIQDLMPHKSKRALPHPGIEDVTVNPSSKTYFFGKSFFDPSLSTEEYGRKYSDAMKRIGQPITMIAFRAFRFLPAVGAMITYNDIAKADDKPYAAINAGYQLVGGAMGAAIAAPLGPGAMMGGGVAGATAAEKLHEVWHEIIRHKKQISAPSSTVEPFDFFYNDRIDFRQIAEQAFLEEPNFFKKYESIQEEPTVPQESYTFDSSSNLMRSKVAASAHMPVDEFLDQFDEKFLSILEKSTNTAEQSFAHDIRVMKEGRQQNIAEINAHIAERDDISRASKYMEYSYAFNRASGFAAELGHKDLSKGLLVVSGVFEIGAGVLMGWTPMGVGSVFSGATSIARAFSNKKDDGYGAALQALYAEVIFVRRHLVQIHEDLIELKHYVVEFRKDLFDFLIINVDYLHRFFRQCLEQINDGFSQMNFNDGSLFEAMNVVIDADLEKLLVEVGAHGKDRKFSLKKISKSEFKHYILSLQAEAKKSEKPFFTGVSIFEQEKQFGVKPTLDILQTLASTRQNYGYLASLYNDMGWWNSTIDIRPIDVRRWLKIAPEIARIRAAEWTYDKEDGDDLLREIGRAERHLNVVDEVHSHSSVLLFDVYLLPAIHRAESLIASMQFPGTLKKLVSGEILYGPRPEHLTLVGERKDFVKEKHRLHNPKNRGAPWLTEQSTDMTSCLYQAEAFRTLDALNLGRYEIQFYNPLYIWRNTEESHRDIVPNQYCAFTGCPRVTYIFQDGTRVDVHRPSGAGAHDTSLVPVSCRSYGGQDFGWRSGVCPQKINVEHYRECQTELGNADQYFGKAEQDLLAYRHNEIRHKKDQLTNLSAKEIALWHETWSYNMYKANLICKTMGLENFDCFMPNYIFDKQVWIDVLENDLRNVKHYRGELPFKELLEKLNEYLAKLYDVKNRLISALHGYCFITVNREKNEEEICKQTPFITEQGEACFKLPANLPQCKDTYFLNVHEDSGALYTYNMTQFNHDMHTAIKRFSIAENHQEEFVALVQKVKQRVYVLPKEVDQLARLTNEVFEPHQEPFHDVTIDAVNQVIMMLKHRYNEVTTRLPHIDTPISNTIPGFVQIPESEYQAMQAQTAALTEEVFSLKKQMQNGQAQSTQEFEKITALLQQLIIQNKPHDHQTDSTDALPNGLPIPHLFVNAASFPFHEQSERLIAGNSQNIVAYLMLTAVIYKALSMLISSCRKISKQKAEKILSYIQFCIVLHVGGNEGWIGAASAYFIAYRLQKVGMSEKNSCIIGNATGLVINLGFFSHRNTTQEIDVKKNPLDF